MMNPGHFQLIVLQRLDELTEQLDEIHRIHEQLRRSIAKRNKVLDHLAVEMRQALEGEQQDGDWWKTGDPPPWT
jgi:uncharacterized protein YaaN involved in tellurite resistance